MPSRFVSAIPQETGDRRLHGSTQQPPLRQDRVVVRIVVFIMLVAGHRRETLVNQSCHHLSTRHQKSNSYKGPSPTTHNSYTTTGDWRSEITRLNTTATTPTGPCGPTNSSNVYYTGGWPSPRDAPKPIVSSPFHTSPEAKFIQGPPTHNPQFIHLEHGKYNVYRNIYKSSLYVVDRRSDALYMLKSLKNLRLKNQWSTNFPNI